VRIRIAITTALLLVLAACSQQNPAPDGFTAANRACEFQTNNTHDKLLECVTVDGVRAHQAAFQAAADANGGTRAAGTPGYDASVAYIVGALEAAGYDVVLDAFDFTFVPPAVLEQLSPNAATHQTGSFTGTGFGTVTGQVIPVDLALGNAAWPADPATSTSGCEATDFDGLDFSSSADIALIQRGTCFFSVKAVNAQNAGAEAVVIMNQGTPGREGLIVANASALPDGTPSNLTIPVVGASFADGFALSQLGSTAFIQVDPPESRPQVNILAELPGKNDDNIVMVGGHLDSVNAGPGVQDNGSGSAAILEVALRMAKVNPVNTVRFGWWGAEESGLLGSTAYVNGLSQEEQDAIALYLNFDMIGSPNHVFFIYDGDDSDGVGAGPGPAGSAQIEALFEQYYTDIAEESFKGTDFSGRSDYGPFIAVGIPAGGLFTGAEGIKTSEEVAIWGGTAGDQYDPCYHLACDTFANVNLHALEVNADAVAYATLQYAMNTVTINGVRGKGNFQPDHGPQPATE
jgi:Zn-dependent M28 family amino/carboxypeptidase